MSVLAVLGIALGVLVILGSADVKYPAKSGSTSSANIYSIPDIKQDAYGPGTHMNQFGQPVTVQPMYDNQPYIPNSVIQTPNAYGPGIHMDQYGRPVQLR